MVGKDVAVALGYSNTRDALSKRVDDEDKRGSQIATPFGTQEMVVISESGLYSLVLSSKLPGARKFRRWVTSEVLPSIRRTGGYNLPRGLLSALCALGYTDSETITIRYRDGTVTARLFIRWTQKGRLLIHGILTRRGIQVVMDKEGDYCPSRATTRSCKCP